MDINQSLREALRPAARQAPPSGIVEMVNHGIGRDGMIPLWAGEGDLPTPDFIREAAIRSLEAGDTFYTYQRGIPPLRQAICDYMTRTFGSDFGFQSDRFLVTGSGMQAIQIAVACVAGPGTSVVLPSPTWPNFAAAVGLSGAQAITVPMGFSNGRWHLDIDALFDAAREDTRAIFINTPGNPTGWTATRDELQEILTRARARGIWIIADEIYTRYYYGHDNGGARAASFHDVAEPDDRILYVNSMSKNWAMTGWRGGRIEAPAVVGETIENLIQYSTSGVATFMQKGAIAALNDGDDFIAEQVARATRGREIVGDMLAVLPNVKGAPPDGAFYYFFSVEGISDVRQLGFDIIDHANVGLAPGTAFGPGGERFMRLCFARSEKSLIQAMERLTGYLSKG